MKAPHQTVKDFAQDAARACSAYLDEAELALELIEFDLAIPSGSKYSRYRQALITILKDRRPVAIQLGYIWLDGHGYGEVPVTDLNNDLAEIKREPGIKL